jgi:hypothetical protein
VSLGTSGFLCSMVSLFCMARVVCAVVHQRCQ